MRGRKIQDIYTSTYKIRETTFSNQTGQFPTRSKSGNKYIMIMVEIDSSAILVKPMKSRKDAEMIQAYNALLLRLQQAGIVPKKHVTDNEVSVNIKNTSKTTAGLQLSLYHQVAINKMQQKLPSGISKHTSSAYWQELPKIFHPAYGTNCYPKLKSHSICYANQTPCQQYQRMPISIARLTTTRCHLHLWGVRFKSTRNQTAVERGHTTPLMDCTCPPCQSITAHMCAISSPPRAINCQILSTSGTNT